MAARKPAAAAPRSGRLPRLLRFTLLFLGFLSLAGLIDYVATTSSAGGRWQFQPPQLSEAQVDTMVNKAQERNEARTGRGPRHLGPGARSVLTQFSNRLLGAVASQVQLELVSGGYRLNGALGAQAATGMLRMNGGPDTSLTGCMSGTYLAAFPLVRATCGDGSGRTLYFLMKRWPSSELVLFPLPFGNDELQRKLKQNLADGPDREKLKAADELLTLRFSRVASN